MRKFTVPTRPFDDNTRLYSRKEVEFHPGLTTLIGCNGSGKTTLMLLIKDKLRQDKDILVLSYDDRFEGGSNLMEALAFRDDMTGVAGMFMSSEGERIIRGVGYFARGIRKRIQKVNPKEIWILLDAVGSGLSIDDVIGRLTADKVIRLIESSEYRRGYADAVKKIRIMSDNLEGGWEECVFGTGS